MQDELSARTEGKRLDTIPFAIGFLSVFAFIVSAIAFPEPFIRFMDLLQDKIVKDLGWASVFFSFLVMLFTFGIVCSPIGSIRIGGRDAKPDFSFFRWFAISLCSGIGIGILFWGIGEPISPLMHPARRRRISASRRNPMKPPCSPFPSPPCTGALPNTVFMPSAASPSP